MTHYRRIVPIVGALLLAACDREPAVDPQLKADLDAAAAGTIEMAPAGAGTKAVSGIEQVQRMQARPTALGGRTSVTVQRPESQEVAPTTRRAEPAATVPTTRPAVQPPPPGGYKSVDEVIRNAPFPIKPATKRPATKKP